MTFYFKQIYNGTQMFLVIVMLVKKIMKELNQYIYIYIIPLLEAIESVHAEKQWGRELFWGSDVLLNDHQTLL